MDRKYTDKDLPLMLNVCWLAKYMSICPAVESPWPGESFKFHPQHSANLAPVTQFLELV